MKKEAAGAASFLLSLRFFSAGHSRLTFHVSRTSFSLLWRSLLWRRLFFLRLILLLLVLVSPVWLLTLLLVLRLLLLPLLVLLPSFFICFFKTSQTYMSNHIHKFRFNLLGF